MRQFVPLSRVPTLISSEGFKHFCWLGHNIDGNPSLSMDNRKSLPQKSEVFWIAAQIASQKISPTVRDIISQGCALSIYLLSPWSTFSHWKCTLATLKNRDRDNKRHVQSRRPRERGKGNCEISRFYGVFLASATASITWIGPRYELWRVLKNGVKARKNEGGKVRWLNLKWPFFSFSFI